MSVPNSNVLFILFPTKSHFNATIEIANALQRNGYNIHYVGGIDPNLDYHVGAQGFKLTSTRTLPFGLNYYLGLNLYKMLKKSKVEYVASRFGDEHFKLRQDSFEKIFDEIHPSIVFLDSFIGNDFIPLYKHLVNRNVKLNFINTMAIFEDKGLPALNSPLVPDQKLKIIIDKLKNRILVSWHKILETIALIGNSSDRIVQRQIRISKIPEYHRPLTNGSLGTTYSKIPELVLGIKEFEFKMLDTPDRHYIGFRPSLKRYEFIKVDQITRLKQVVQASDKIVYISFGTLYSNTKKELLRLIEIIFNYANEVPNISFIFSNMSKSIIEKIALETPSNVFLFGFIPQTAVLSKSDIFITHGGMNSIRESIHSTVPMLVFPIKDGYDQIGNAARVAFHKLGLAGHLHNISKARLGEMIMELINTPMYKENLERFKIRSESQLADKDLLSLITSGIELSNS